MSSSKPHYLLFCDGGNPANSEPSAVSNRGRWRFVLEHVESGSRTEATDQELSSAPDRTALLAVLRGLESLEQPSRVTLVTTSRYVSRGLQYGLSEWRENEYSWEHFGTVQPIRNADLWRRIDRALTFHHIQCRYMASGDPQESSETATEVASSTEQAGAFDTESCTTSAAQHVGKTQTHSQESDGNYSQDSIEKPVSSRRSSVSVAQHHRVYVDTPPRSQDAVIDKSTPSHRADHRDWGAVRTTQPRMMVPHELDPSPRTLAPVPVGSGWMARSFSGAFANFVSGAKILCLPITMLARWLWKEILAIDEFLDSCIRCMLLLDPRVDRTDRRYGR